MKTPFHKIKEKVLGDLEEKLPEFLTYHDVAHTEYVLAKVEEISEIEKVEESDLELLKVAALYHDSGFTTTLANHESAGCEKAMRELGDFGYSDEEINRVCNMIAATRIPQQPQNHLEAVLADADLEYLGTPLFETIGDRLYQELKHFNPAFSREDWNQLQIKFLEGHSYHTHYGKTVLSPKKHAHLAELKAQFSAG